jgi:hypothetical protein
VKIRHTALALQVILLTSALLTSGDARGEAAPAAVVSWVKGRAFVSRADRTVEALKEGTLLYLGDKARLEAQSEVAVLFPDRPKTVWRGGQRGARFEVNPPSRPRDSAIRRVWRFLVEKLTSDRTRTVQAASRSDEWDDRGIPMAARGWAREQHRAFANLEPRDSKVRQLPSVLSWGAASDATYRVEIMDPDAETVWEHGGLTTDSVEYPADAPGLAPGTRYYWQVTAVGANVSLPSPLVWFEVVTDDDNGRIATELAKLEGTLEGLPEPAAHVYRASLLGSFELHAEARAELALAGDAEQTTEWRELFGQVEP